MAFKKLFSGLLKPQPLQLQCALPIGEHELEDYVQKWKCCSLAMRRFNSIIQIYRRLLLLGQGWTTDIGQVTLLLLGSISRSNSLTLYRLKLRAFPSLIISLINNNMFVSNNLTIILPHCPQSIHPLIARTIITNSRLTSI